ncbi:MmpS family transport accessory protein [Paractinoplanes hotanensis]|uniref:MmpS family transport accessory protein n=1 Tax=Paractinoplanes hotanensis TaxID=2906497 RepID=A0ABT0XZM9_9ACTN|nr:MmpS family transport accessory protein [Actinoplanes hotanensis]MCM4078529.1 MmpS family transport accessory protein [Actinoplanes hotanensis]
MTNADQDGGPDDRRSRPPTPAAYAVPGMPVAPVPDDGYVEQAPRRRDRRLVWFAASVLALLACFSGVLLTVVSDGDRFERAPAVTAVAPVVETDPPSAAAPVEVVYLVTSSGRGDLARVEYTDQDRDIIRKGEVSLPWRLTFEFVGDKPPLVLLAQRKEGGAGAMTCSITVGGKELTTAVQRGRYAAPQCSA